MDFINGLPIATIFFIVLVIFVLYSTLKTVPQGITGRLNVLVATLSH